MRKWAFWTVAALCAAGAGCVYRGAKATEGTSLTIGLSVPGTEGAASLTLVEYVSGFRLGVAENATATLKYRVAESNDYFGVVRTRSYKSADATVSPAVTNAAAGVRSVRQEK